MLRKVDMELLVNRMEEFSRLFKKLNGLILQYYDINESAIHIFSILKKFKKRRINLETADRRE